MPRQLHFAVADPRDAAALGAAAGIPIHLSNSPAKNSQTDIASTEMRKHVRPMGSAKPSNFGAAKNHDTGWRRRFAPRNLQTCVRASRRDAPEPLHEPSAQRAWGMPGAQCTRSLVCAGVVSMHTSVHSGGTGNHPAFPHANGFNGLYRALLGE